HLARLMLPILADYCIIDVIGMDGHIHRVAAAHVNPAREELLGKLRRYVPGPNTSDGPAKALHAGQTAYLPQVTDETLAAWAVDAEHLKILHELGPQSAVIAPMRARGRTLGSITLCTSGRT